MPLTPVRPTAAEEICHSDWPQDHLGPTNPSYCLPHLDYLDDISFQQPTISKSKPEYLQMTLPTLDQ